MNKKYIKIIVALISLNLLFQLSSFAQRIVVVKDAGGNPVPGVSVTIGEGTKPVLTNEKGEFTLKIDSKTSILFEAEGFDPQVIIAYPAVELESVVITKPSVQMGLKDKVNVPFGSFKKRQIPAAVTAFNPDDILISTWCLIFPLQSAGEFRDFSVQQITVVWVALLLWLMVYPVQV